MGERKWTEEQLSAIEERSKTLLVSAAAGSGKTATLTERIIRSLTDEGHPVAIENILSVTFTTAAAGELRAKLTRALEEACANDPENRLLRHQLNMLPSAKIRTIDSFCNDILKMGADRVGLSPNYRIADTAECELLAISILEGLISATYRGELPEVATAEEFEALAECLTDTKRVEELSEVFRELYSKFDSSELAIDAMLPLIKNFEVTPETSVENTPHGAYLLEIFREFAEHFRAAFARYREPLLSGTEGEIIYFSLCTDDLSAVDDLLAINDYKSLRTALLTFEVRDLPRLKKNVEKTPLMEEYGALHNDFRTTLKKKFLKFFSYSESEWLQSSAGLHKLLLVLYRFEKKFDELFLEEKKRRGALSYADVERLCYACLIKDGEPTDIALNLANQFEALYIDEYQDVNSLQNSIFGAISREDNRFMVGDIKQSIYGFRLACPEIFASMKAKFPPLPKALADGGECASIFMSKNFRCDKGIVDFVNGIFDKTFSLIGKSIGYEDGDKLAFAKVYEGDVMPEYRAPEVCVVIGGPSQAAEDDEEGEALGEAEIVAEKIAELLASGTLNNGKAPEPSDIAIILRSAKTKNSLYADALKKRGIPAEISGAKSFFLSSEVLLTLCLLNTIDNPRRDIYLAGLMCSPLFSFTADELYKIRRGGEGETLWEALLSYCSANPSFERGKYFLSKIDYYRTIAEGISVDTLLSKLYRESGLLALAAHSGGTDNLMVLYDYARSYEAGTYKGLYSFISYINNIIDKRTSFDDKRAGSSSNAVKIITCHSSKGLEYPIVFLGGAGGSSLGQDTFGRLVYSADMGITFRQRTPSGLAMVASPIHDLNCHYVIRKEHEEELRILYVALTRAREQLYVVGKAKTKTREAYDEKINYLKDNLSAYTLRSTRNYLDLIAMTMDGSYKFAEDFIQNLDVVLPNDNENAAQSKDTSAADGFELPDTLSFEELEEPSADEAMIDELISRFTFKYPNEYLTMLPEKFSVSRAHPHMLEVEDEGELLFAEDTSEDENIPEGEDAFDSEDITADAEIAKGTTLSKAEISAENCAPYDDFQGGKTALAEGVQKEESGEKKRRLPAFAVGRAAEESARRGIATHMVLQFCNLERMEREGAEAELATLLADGFLTKQDKERVRIGEIKKFLGSKLFREMKSAKALHRELRFNLLFPANMFTADEEQRAALAEKDVLVQGVIDCIIEKEDGSLVLIDYKTDRLLYEELKNPALAKERLNKKHSLQLSYYAYAVEKLFGRAPAAVGVYSLPLGSVVDIDIESARE